VENLDYNQLSLEIEKKLEKAENIVLATSANNIVTGRTMNHVNDGLAIMFGTGGKSLKAEQIRLNKNVALICGPLQIEATAELYGHPSKHTVYIEKNEKKFPWMKNAFPPEPDGKDDSILVICHPKKISFYKYLNGESHWDVLEVEDKKAYRL
jgi:general stress protein 26